MWLLNNKSDSKTSSETVNKSSIKTILLIIFLICLICGIIINYNISNVKFGTNLTLIGMLGIVCTKILSNLA